MNRVVSKLGVLVLLTYLVISIGVLFFAIICKIPHILCDLSAIIPIFPLAYLYYLISGDLFPFKSVFVVNTNTNILGVAGQIPMLGYFILLGTHMITLYCVVAVIEKIRRRKL